MKRVDVSKLTMPEIRALFFFFFKTKIPKGSYKW
jgi:hypothetical protein